MSIDGNMHFNPEIEGNNNQHLKRLSVLSSSNPTSDSRPIDCILVYDRLSSDQESQLESDPEQPNKKHKKPSERRNKFEEYLSKKQHLILERVVSSTKEFPSNPLVYLGIYIEKNRIC